MKIINFGVGQAQQQQPATDKSPCVYNDTSTGFYYNLTSLKYILKRGINGVLIFFGLIFRTQYFSVSVGDDKYWRLSFSVCSTNPDCSVADHSNGVMSCKRWGDSLPSTDITSLIGTAVFQDLNNTQGGSLGTMIKSYNPQSNGGGCDNNTYRLSLLLVCGDVRTVYCSQPTTCNYTCYLIDPAACPTKIYHFNISTTVIAICSGTTDKFNTYNCDIVNNGKTNSYVALYFHGSQGNATLYKGGEFKPSPDQPQNIWQYTRAIKPGQKVKTQYKLPNSIVQGQNGSFVVIESIPSSVLDSSNSSSSSSLSSDTPNTTTATATTDTTNPETLPSCGTSFILNSFQFTTIILIVVMILHQQRRRRSIMGTTTNGGATTPPLSLIEYHEGMGVWIPDATLEWIAGDVVSYNSDNGEVVVRVEIEEEGEKEITVPNNKIYLQNPDILEGIDDLAGLSHLHEAAILHNLHHRYNLDQIYTYIGKILIAINPYQSLPLYGREMISAYYGKQLGALSPHVYAVAEDAFKDMRYDGTSQSILVSGESGAGKTETTKFLLQYFAAMGNMVSHQQGGSSASSTPSLSGSSSSIPHLNINSNNNNGSSGNPPQSPSSKKTTSSEKSIEERVLESTPLLEAFGNAKTLRNDNSSRFGKFIEIHFNELGSIIGAKILTYLLEKSRLVRQVYNERNYHIFYQLLAGANDELRESLYLMNAQDYYYLNQSQCFEIDGVDDSDMFQRTCHAMGVAGINTQDQENIFKILSVVLLLGNIVFMEEANDGSSIDEGASGGALEKIATLLGTSAVELSKTFLTRKVVSGKEVFTTANTKERAENARDSLSMLLYGLMFDWLVVKINAAMSAQQKSKSFIGILDIYGFESFAVNGFEQFCINYANEKLQQVFNQHVFKEEQQEYIKEKIDWSYIDFNDNQDTLDLIEKRPMCILSLLDEESMFPKSTGATFATKLYSKLTSHAKFEKPRFSGTAFTINHYAGRVTYETDQFLDKNKDFIIPEQISLLQRSQTGFVKTILSTSNDRLGGGGGAQQNNPNKPSSAAASSSMKFSSVGSQFSTSLATLMKTIGTTSPHYVRCVKPNPDKAPHTFNKHDVIHQLRCGGVMESVRICCAGFPTRRTLVDFYPRYKILYPASAQVAKAIRGTQSTSKDPKDVNAVKQAQVRALLEGIELSDDKYKLGTTKVFLRAGQLAALENMRMDKLNGSATTIQTAWRKYICAKQYRALLRAAVTIQNKIRSQLARNQLAHLQRNHAAKVIQTAYRGYIKRRDYQRQKHAAVVLQSALRKMSSRHELQEKKTMQAATYLQAIIRACNDRRDTSRRLRGIVRLQAKWRGKMARKEYKDLRIEARSLKTVQEAKNQLQAKLEEIQWRLTTEQRAKQHIEETKIKMEKQLEQIQSTHDHVLLELSEYKSKSESLETSNTSMSDELTVLRKELEETRQTLSEHVGSLKKLEREKLDSTETIKSVSEELATVKQQYEETSTTKQQLEQSLKELKSSTTDHIKDLESRLGEKTMDCGVATGEVASLRKQVERLEEETATVGHMRDTIQRSFDELVGENASLRDEMERTRGVAGDEYDRVVAIKESTEKELHSTLENVSTLQATVERHQQQHAADTVSWKSTEEGMKQQINQLVNGGDELRLKLSQKEQEHVQLVEKYKKIKGKLENVEQDSRVASTDNEKIKMARQLLEDEKGLLNQQITSAKLEKEKLEVTNQHQKEKITQIKQTLEQSTLESNRIKNDLSNRENDIAKLNLETSDLKNQIARQSKEILELSSSSQIEKSKSDLGIVQYERTISDQKQEMEKQQSTIKQYDRDLVSARENQARLEMEIKQLTSLKERFENEFFVATTQNSSSAQESVYLKEVTTQMQQNQTRLEKELEDKKQVINRLEDERDDIVKKHDILNVQFDQVTEQLTLVKSGFESLKNVKLRSKKEKIQALETNVSQLSQEILQLKNAGTQNQDSIHLGQEQIKKSKEKYHQIKQQLQTQKETAIKLESENSILRQQQSFVEQSFNETKMRNADLSELVLINKQKVELAQSDMERLASIKSSEMENLRTNSNQEIESLRATLDSLQVSEQATSAKLAALEREREQLADEKSSVQEQSAGMESELEQLRQENAQLRHQAFEEKKSRRKSVEIQQVLEDAKVVQSGEITTLKQNVEQLQSEKDEWKNERLKMMDVVERMTRERDAFEQKYQQYNDKFKAVDFRLRNFQSLEEIINYKESDWEKLARNAGNQEVPTKMLSNFLLSCKLEHSTLACQLWYHQISYWKCFERSEPYIFKGIIKSILEFTRNHHDELDLTAYLLACTSLLLYVFQAKLPTGKTTIMPSIPSIADIEDTENILESESSANPSAQFIDLLHQSVGRSYGMAFKTVISKLQPLIEGSILNENYNRKSVGVSSISLHSSNSNIQSAPLLQIDHVTSHLFSIISLFQQKWIHFSLSQQFFSQIFHWIGITIFNGIMLRQAFCTESFALHLKSKIDYLVKWANEIGDVWVGPVDSAFVIVKEIIAVLTNKDKEKFADEKYRKTVCPSINANQLKQVLSMFSPTEFGKKVSAKTLNSFSTNKLPISLNQPIIMDEKKLFAFPIKSLHYFEKDDINNMSIPLSIRYSIETEIKNISYRLTEE
ncbi:myosin-5b [Cavenderia fasciculata]|uniref:Myosin-5b n=1 Tax=Cavenderia fasciculata TaxID=261658 RepID=F4PIV1_CACFS|nr:myosin-5b [Cavenderia fasciculata]EGG24237.1 myosin-5b [Cavenderia fasciculata]|eukprot:XP_004362088.1 myosin-5b [Cavenderia fasciculata]